MYCVTKSLLNGLPVLSVPFKSCVTPRSRSYAMESLETLFVVKESCAYVSSLNRSLARIEKLIFCWVGRYHVRWVARYSGLQETSE